MKFQVSNFNDFDEQFLQKLYNLRDELNESPEPSLFAFLREKLAIVPDEGR